MTTILALHGLATHFGGLPAVDGVDLAVERGSITALIGPNGAGKSTLLRTIAGLHTPTRGRVVLDGVDVTGLPPHEVRRQGIATVLQTPRPLTSMTVRESATLGAMFGTPGGRRDERTASAAGDEALDVVGLAARAHDLVGALTVHERRRLDLARALAGSPRLLLLDEPLAGLHAGELDEAMTVLRGVRDGVGLTIVWVEHVVAAVRSLAEQVVVLDHGELLAEGPPDVVMRDERVAAAYLGEGTATGGRG